MGFRLFDIALTTLQLLVPAFGYAQVVTGPVTTSPPDGPVIRIPLPVSILSKQRLGTQCWNSINANAALDCWLRKHPSVAEAMSYESPTYGGSWPTWPAAVKNEFYSYFNRMSLWYKQGMQPSYPTLFPVPVPWQGQPDPVFGFRMTNAMAWRVYLSQTANSLAAELTGAFPWTITTYAPAPLSLLLAMGDSMQYVPNASAPGYFFLGDSPASPGYTVGFLKTNNLIGSDASDTVARLFGWERHLQHYFEVTGDPLGLYFPYFWGPDSPPIPDSAIIDGTTYSGPGSFGFGHFTAGCGGTMSFMKSVLRSVNIPVENHLVSCQHATPIFPTVNMAMTHGDDPYDSLGLILPYPGFGTPEMAEYFISVSRLNQLFPQVQTYDACISAVGLQVANIAIKYGSDYLMAAYCEDLRSGAAHPDGQVYGYLKHYSYTVQTLESSGLWTTLDNKVHAINYCGH